MLSSFLTLSIALGFAAAAPTARQAPNYPPHSQSTAFNLVANVTGEACSFDVQNYVLTGYHVGAGQDIAVLTPNITVNSSRIFYENGTAEEVRYGASSILFDGGTPPFPFGLIIQNATEFNTKYTTEHDVYLSAGSGTIGVGLTQFPAPVPVLAAPAAGSFAACNNTILGGTTSAITLEYAYDNIIPAGCVAITLIPQCATLNTLPTGSLSSHEYASIQNCYDDVSAIDWTVYSAS